MSVDLLRQLPGIDTWLESEHGAALSLEFSQIEVADVMRDHLSRLRLEIRAGRSELPPLDSASYAGLLRADLLARRVGSLRTVVNATGIVIHTNLGRAPLAAEALAAIQNVAAGFTNLEYDLDRGKRGERGQHVESLLCELTGAEAALVVNNCAAAVLLTLRALAASGEVIASRGELIEIGGSFRMPDVIAQSGARLVEVGTTNRTSLKDYEAAIGAESRVLLASHPSNYRVIGFTQRADPRELGGLASRHGLAFVNDLGSGGLVDPRHAGLAPEPTVQECLRQGANIVTFSGDKMLGGPQAGIILGRADLIQRLRRHPFARAMRIDKLSLAALAATLRLYRPPHDPWERIPVLQMIGASASAVGVRANAIVEQLAAHTGISAVVEPDVSYAGGGTLPLSKLATRVIAISSPDTSASVAVARLRAGDMPVIARVDRDRVIFDLRTVLPAQEAGLVMAIRRAYS